MEECGFEQFTKPTGGGLVVNVRIEWSYKSPKGLGTTFSSDEMGAEKAILFSCNQFEGALVEQNAESLKNEFFPLNELPENLFVDQKIIFNDLLSNVERPIIK